MKRSYEAPRLLEYGRIDEVTLGSTGDKPDAVIVGGVPQIDPSNPTCENNVTSGYCYHF